MSLKIFFKLRVCECAKNIIDLINPMLFCFFLVDTTTINPTSSTGPSQTPAPKPIPSPEQLSLGQFVKAGVATDHETCNQIGAYVHFRFRSVLRLHPWYSGSVLDCWFTGRATDPAPAA